MRYFRRKPKPTPPKRMSCVGDPNCALMQGFQWCTCHSIALTIARNGHDHWLLFNDDREITGCNCGFEADVDSDCGWGDSVVAHLLSVGGAA